MIIINYMFKYKTYNIKDEKRTHTSSVFKRFKIY